MIRYRKSARTVLTGKQSINLITLHGLILNKFNFSECSSQNLFSLKQITAKYKNCIKRQITSLGIVLLSPKRKLDLGTVIWKLISHEIPGVGQTKTCLKLTNKTVKCCKKIKGIVLASDECCEYAPVSWAETNYVSHIAFILSE